MCVVALGGCVLMGGGGKGGSGGGGARPHRDFIVMSEYDESVDAATRGDAELAARAADKAVDDYQQALDLANKAQKKIDDAGPRAANALYRIRKGYADVSFDEMRRLLAAAHDNAAKKLDAGVVIAFGRNEAVVNLQYAIDYMQKAQAAGPNDAITAYRFYVQAENAANGGQSRVEIAKRAGTWKPHIHYQTKTEGVLGDADVVAALAKVREDAAAGRRAAEPTTLGAWGRKYGRLSDAQQKLLVSAGEPASVDRARCWVYKDSHEPVCWDAKGNRKESKVAMKPKAPRRHGGGGGGDRGQAEQGGGEEAGADCLKAELENATDQEVHVNSCGMTGPLNSNTTEDVEPNCTLEVEGQKVTPKPCQHCTYNGSLHCE